MLEIHFSGKRVNQEGTLEGSIIATLEINTIRPDVRRIEEADLLLDSLGPSWLKSTPEKEDLPINLE